MVYTKLNPSLTNQYTDTELYQAFDQGIYDAHYFVAVTPEMYGAVGDGVADDTAEVQAAADAANVQGRTLYLPETKSYRLTSTVVADCDVAGRGTLIYGFSPGTFPALWLTGDYHTVRDITIQCQYQTWSVGLRIENTNHTLVENIKVFQGYFGHVMIGSNAIDTTIRGCYFQGSGFGVIYDDHPQQQACSGSHTINIIGNRYIGEPGSGFGGDGVELNAPAYGTSHVSVLNNYIENTWDSGSGSLGLGIGIAGVQHALIANNSINGTYHDGIHFETGITTTAFSSGVTYGANRHVTNAGKVYIAQATIPSGGAAPTHTSGTVNNWLYLMAAPSFGFSSDVLIIGNRVVNAGTLGTTKLRGIEMDATHGDVIGNEVYGAGSEGIEYMAGSGYSNTAIAERGMLIANNRVERCGNNGISILGMIGTQILNNTIKDCSQTTNNSGSGLIAYIDPVTNIQIPDDLVIRGNTISGARHHSHLRFYYGTNIIERDNRLYTDAVTAPVFIDAGVTTIRGEPYAAVQDVNANGFTIAIGSLKSAIFPLTAGAARTGVILAAGYFHGQRITLINRSANTIQFAAVGTSRVADGTSTTLAVNRAYDFMWDADFAGAAAGRWVRTGS